METWLDKLLEKIVMKFHIGNKENIDVKSKIGEGLSGAEVYLVELKGDSQIKGYFFLKIDSEAEEYENNLKDFCFSKVIKCIEKSEIDGYYVMLLQIAGNSSAEYKSFYSIYKSSVKIEAVRKIIGEVLEESTNERDIVDDYLMPSNLFKMQLKNKLDVDGVMAQFLSKHLRGCPLKNIFTIKIKNEIYPNAFSYAINDVPWGDKRIENMTCCMHGDFHGNNVFVSSKSSDYAIIDMASYREDGWLFFDTAYFEYSLMIHNMEKESLENWLYCIEQVAKQAWDEVDFRDSRVIRAIAEEEERWIEKMVTYNFNYLDQFRNARLIARVLVGLNYAGKRNMSDDARLKAYIYACCHLKYLLLQEGINYISSKVYEWKNDSEKSANISEWNHFLEYAGKFNDSQNYYLILGRQWDYSDTISMNVGKIYWSGIVSFCKEKGFAEILQKKQLLRNVIPNNEITWDYIKKNSTWWLYADGIEADPESRTDNFPKWKNKYREFWSQFTNKMIESVAEDDLLFIIDGAKFQDGDDKYIRYLLNQLDAIDSVVVNIAILEPETGLFEVEAQDYENLNIMSFKIGMENIAEYCSLYLSELVDDIIYIPNRLNRIGIPLNRQDQQYIEQYTILVHEQLIRRENILAESEKYKFFYGEPITWTAIEEELYVKHKKIKFYEDTIRQKLENTNKDQILISIQHFPGAGASILGRVICWNLKKEYPTFVLQNKFDEDVYESLLRISAISGKHLLIFLDGNYNQNDVNQFLYRIRGMKVCVLYACRVYSMKNVDDEMISVLEARDGDLFRDEYEKVMKKWKNYDDAECERRIHNMERLTTENKLIDFRIPFFYGMHAFEDDYQGIYEYLNDVINFMEQHENMEKVILYIALISYYTENKGLGFKYARKMLKMERQSGRELLKELQENFPSIIYIVNSSYRICHPIIAKKILEMKFKKFQSEQYKNFCIQFIEDLRKCESSNGNLSDGFSELMMDIFIKRDTEDEIKENDRQKKSFSQIILEVANSNLQEQIYERLVKILPKNPQFHQHYGRLIIANNPMNLKEAEEQLNEAIKIDNKNGSFYHSRGNLYVQYVLHQMNNAYKNLSGYELYNKLRYYVDLALSDFESSVKLEERGNNISDLVYPYTSIVQITTTFVHQLAKRLGFSGNEKEFLKQDKEINRWSKKIVSNAILYDIDTEFRYSLIRSNKFYNSTRSYLSRFKWTSDELEMRIEDYPNDYDYQIAYLGMCISEKSAWKQKSQQQLRKIIGCCENLLKIEMYETEGILWKWFNAYIRLKQPVNVTYNKMLGILETLPNKELNATANFLCSILYFCKYMQTKEEKMIDSMYDCLQICKKLAGNRKNQSVTHYYYTDEMIVGKNILPLEFDRENAYWFDATVISADSVQSGYLTLDMNPKLRAFFVPMHTELKRNQEIGQLVKVKIGFRFDGLSAWELKQKN